MSPDEVHDVRNDWVTFSTAFKAEFFTISNPTDASINWVAWRQESGETVYRYTFRVNSAASIFFNFFKTRTVGIAPAEPAWPPAGPAMTLIQQLDPQERQIISTANHEDNIEERDFTVRSATNVLVLKAVLNGLKDLRLKETIHKLIQEQGTMREALQAIRDKERTLLPEATKAFHIKAIEGQVSAINTNNRGYAHKRRPPPAGPRSVPPNLRRSQRINDPNKYCSFHNRTGHTDDECFAKKKAETGQGRTRHSDTNGHAEPPNVHAIQSSPEEGMDDDRIYAEEPFATVDAIRGIVNM
jgi:hypothetical protein